MIGSWLISLNCDEGNHARCGGEVITPEWVTGPCSCYCHEVEP